MKEQYMNNIETHKEVLNALPKNNDKNLKVYKEKVSELLTTYREDLSSIIEEIDKRTKHYLSLGKDERIDTIDSRISELSSILPIINTYNSSYEKSNLDKILYQLGHYYTIDLNSVNSNILKAIEVFKTIGINLTANDFNYSYYAKKYLEKLLSLDPKQNTYLEELKQTFEDIYWKCPDIINHITLNFKYLYYLNQKKFDTYYENKISMLTKENLNEQYLNLIINKDNLIQESKFLILNKFLTNELNINDYTEDKVNKLKEQLIATNNYNDEDIIDLSHTLYEYHEYLSLNYLIIDIKNLYNDKLKYKGIYLKKKKEIIKKERLLFKENAKISKCITKNNNKKFDYYNNLINNDINTLKGLYEELENSFFLEKISNLTDDSTIQDVLILSISNYNYLIELFKKNSLNPEEEISKIFNLINYPYMNLINNIWIKEEKDIPLIIMDKYNLYGFNINKEMLEKDNLDSLINTIDILLNSILIKKHNLDSNKIKFIKESQNILKNSNQE